LGRVDSDRAVSKMEKPDPLEHPPPRTRRIGTRWMLVVLVVVVVAGFYGLGFQDYLAWDSIRANLDAWKAATDAHLLVAIVLFFLIYATVVALSLPVAVFLSLLAGALFGRWLGTAVVSLASTLGATLAFLLSRYLLRDWVQRRFGARLTTINRGIERDGAYYLFTLRLLPVVPFFLINLGMGLTPMRASTFALVSWLGMLLGTFLYVNAGTELAHVESPRGILSPEVLVSLALLGVVPLVLRLILNRAWRRRS
jgi:uncharacterized membrane protein YdjX (TVP38/TMEM64 family)